MSVPIGKKMLALLLLIPLAAAAAWAAEVPRLTVSAFYYPQSATDKSAFGSASESPLITVVGTTADGCNPAFAGVERRGDQIEVRGQSLQTILPCEDEAWIRQFRLDPLPPGTYTVRVILDDKEYARLSLLITKRSQAVLIPDGSGLYSVEVTYKHPVTGEATAAEMKDLSRSAAAFWFFDPSNPEITVKVLDGRGVNGHHWVFVSSLTTMDFVVRVEWCATVDVGPCQAKEYRSPAGKNLDFADVKAF